MNYIALDFEGLRISHNNFIIKEFAFYNINTHESNVVFIKSPPKTRFSASINSTINWLTKYYHNINWNFYNTSYKYVEHFLNSSDYTTFLVKGTEKTEFIKRKTKAQVINLDTLGCPKLGLLPEPDTNCSFKKHYHSEHCALRKAVAFGQWYNGKSKK